MILAFFIKKSYFCKSKGDEPMFGFKPFIHSINQPFNQPMKRQIFLFVLALMSLTVSAQTKTIQRQPKPAQQTPAKPTPKQSKPATKPTKASPKPKQSSKPAGASLCPDGNHPHMIDLGLPSGTKWACCNVGANKPEEYGGYYAWGETETKSTYSWSTYIHCDGTRESCHDIGKDISGTKYDVAHVKWGGSWVMPTGDQQDELRNNCTYKWTTVNGVEGGRFTSKKNGKSIFLPAAGYRYGSGLSDAGSGGFYWSSTQNPSNTNNAYNLNFYSGDVDWSGDSRYNGQGVRPVVRN